MTMNTCGKLESRELRLRESLGQEYAGLDIRKVLDGSVPDRELYGWIEDSYRLIFEKLPKYKQKEIQEQL